MQASLKQALTNADTRLKDSQLPRRIETVINAIELDMTINPNLREDYLTMLRSSAVLGEALSDDSYPADLITNAVSSMVRVSANILSHLTSNRMMVYGYGIEHTGTRQLLKTFFPDEKSANEQLAVYKSLGAGNDVRVIPMTMMSQLVHRPSVPPPTVLVNKTEHEQAIAELDKLSTPPLEAFEHVVGDVNEPAEPKTKPE